MFTWSVVVGYITKGEETLRRHFEVTADNYEDAQDKAINHFRRLTPAIPVSIREMYIARVDAADSIGPR